MMSIDPEPGPGGEQCESCYYFVALARYEAKLLGYTDQHDVGSCRFSAPLKSTFPVLRADLWCRNFKTRA